MTVKADLEHRADELERQFRGYVQFDWLYFGRYDRLHAPVDMDVDTYEWRAENVTFACGWHAATAWIPGIFSRMSTPRCAHCCDRLGVPRGTGSPKNDPECRALLGLDTMNPEARSAT